MNNKVFYTFPQKVIDFNTQYYKKYRIILEFPTALKLMYKANLLSEKELPVPGLSATMSFEDFKYAYNHYPLSASDFLNIPDAPNAIDESFIFPKRRDVFCIRHERMIGPHFPYRNTYFAIAYVYTGNCTLYYNEDKYKLTAGDICIIQPEFPHYFLPDYGSFVLGIIVRSSSFNIVFNDILVPNNDISDFFRDSVIYKKRDNFAVIRSDTTDDELRFFLQAFAIECLQDNTYDNSCAISLLKLFLANACRKYSDRISFHKAIYSRTKPDEAAIMHFIQNNYKTATLKNTADFFHYNVSYISRRIKEYFGRSFVEVLNEVKIDHAKKALEISEMKISEVALNSGFSSQDHFSKTFKKITGLSPIEYRLAKKN